LAGLGEQSRQQQPGRCRVDAHGPGSLYLGSEDENGAPVTAAPYELVRLALPRRTYGLGHLDYVGEVLAATVKDKERIPGYRLVEQPPLLRHFRCKPEPVPH
jgi:tryptophanase